MEEKKKKTFIIEINGVKESTENVEKLIDALDRRRPLGFTIPWLLTQDF